MSGFPNININRFELSAALCRQSYHEFVKEFWDINVGSRFEDNWHIGYLCDEAQIVGEWVINRQPKLYDLNVNIPPGMTKSTIFSINFLPWLWTRNMGVRALVASHTIGLSEEFNIKAKKVINSDKYKAYFGEVPMDPKMDRNQQFRNIHNGEMTCCGVNGNIMGKHYDLHIYDDLLQRKQADSEASRHDVEVFVTDAAASRKTNRKTTPIISVCQRLHSSDQTGIIEDNFRRVKNIIIPMDCVDFQPEPPELKKFYIDGLIQPTRFGWEEVKDVKGSTESNPDGTKKGKKLYDTQYGQIPGVATGEIWKDDFKWINDNELPKTKFLADYGTDWDFAYTKKTKNSATAYVTGGRLGEKLFVYDLNYFWKETPAIKSFMRNMKNPGTHYIENKANGKAIHDDMREEGRGVFLVTDIPNSGDSIARASLASDYTCDVYIARSLKHRLLHDKKQGLLKFPNADNDDLSDAFAQFILRQKQMKSAIW